MNESLVLTDDIAAVSKIPLFKANAACDVRGKSDGRLDLRCSFRTFMLVQAFYTQ